MKIYRLQNNQNLGPYTTGAMASISMKVQISRRPEPSEEYEFAHFNFNGSILRFGFDSLEKLVEWFPIRELRFLLQMGFTIVELEADVAIQSPTQLAFDPTNSQVIKEIKTLKELVFAMAAERKEEVA